MENMNNIEERFEDVAENAVDAVVEAVEPKKGNGLIGWVLGGAATIATIVCGICWWNKKKKAKAEKEEAEEVAEEKAEETPVKMIFDESGNPIE